MVADLEALVSCESPSADLGAVRTSAAQVAAMGERYLEEAPQVLDVDGCTHLRWRLPGDGPRLLLLGHHDTVWPVGTLPRLPWQLSTSPAGDLARGPGCFDMKAGLVQLFHALAVCPDRAGITVLITGDEEVGSPTSRQLIETEAIAADAAFVLEASAAGALKTARKGVSTYLLEVTGRAAHAGLEPERGINAGVEVARQLLHLLSFGSPISGSTVTPTTLSAGTTTNTVPSIARLAVDVRCWSTAEQQRIDTLMRNLSPTLAGSVLRLRGGVNRPPLERRRAGGLFDLARQVATRLGLPDLEECGVGGASDGNFVAALGTPTLDGLGAVGAGAHADDEHVVIEQMALRAALLAGLIGEFKAGRVPLDNLPEENPDVALERG